MKKHPCKKCKYLTSIKSAFPCKACDTPQQWDLYIQGKIKYEEIPPIVIPEIDDQEGGRFSVNNARRGNEDETARQKITLVAEALGYQTVKDMWENLVVRGKNTRRETQAFIQKETGHRISKHHYFKSLKENNIKSMRGKRHRKLSMDFVRANRQL